MSSFDLCCPHPNGKAPDSPGKRGYAADGALSDEDSFGPAPPPPEGPFPDDDGHMQARSPKGDKFNDEYDDADRVHDMEKGSDPPQETTHDLSDGDMDEDDGEYEEDLSVEIPPTKVVQRMIEEDDDEKAERGGRTLCWAGIVACCLVVAALVLGIGFGTGAFTEEEDNSRSITPPTDVGGGNGTGGTGTGTGGTGSDGTGGGDANQEPPVVFTDPETLAGLDITEFISGVSLADASVFEDVESPEYLAMNYILAAEGDDSFDTNLPEDRDRLVQMYSLLTLWYSSTEGWNDESGWVQTSDVCGWAGVTCVDPLSEQDNETVGDGQGDTEDNGDGDGQVDELDVTEGNGENNEQDNGQGTTVTEIDMTDNGLTGPIPIDIALLSNLRKLKLSDNNIVGPLPRSLFVMSNLEEFSIDNNLIEDELTSVSGMESLSIFVANNNNLSGDIRLFWELPRLTILVLDDNSFSGTLDGISALQDLGKHIL